MKARLALSLGLALGVTLGNACADIRSPQVVARKQTIADSADQILFGQRTTITDKGLNRAMIISDTAYFFDENTRADMRVVNGIFFDSQGNTDAVLSSRTGLYNERLKSLEARGDVRITSTDGRKLTTPYVRYDSRVNIISSDTIFTMTAPDGKILHGIGFRTDPDLNNLKVDKVITAKAGTVVVPE